MALSPKSPETPIELSRGRPEPCDRCGYSRIAVNDESDLRVRSHPLYRISGHLADSLYEVVIPMDPKPAGHLYFCGHHMKQYEAFIASKGYKVREWK